MSAVGLIEQDEAKVAAKNTPKENGRATWPVIHAVITVFLFPALGYLDARMEKRFEQSDARITAIGEKQQQNAQRLAAIDAQITPPEALIRMFQATVGDEELSRILAHRDQLLAAKFDSIQKQLDEIKNLLRNPR